jgi:hypothetical protein
MLYTILYTSRAKWPFQKHELLELVNDSQIWNSFKSITGCLAYVEGVLNGDTLCQFIQVLEGSEAEVREVFANIKLDSRHIDVSLIKEGKIDRRKFGAWKMGFEQIQLGDNPILQDFFSMDSVVLSADGDTDSNLLMEFMKSFCDQKESIECECVTYQEFM